MFFKSNHSEGATHIAVAKVEYGSGKYEVREITDTLLFYTNIANISDLPAITDEFLKLNKDKQP